MKSFKELGIDVSEIKNQGKTTCPRCSHKRKKKDETCLSVNVETGQFHCHNCGYSGGTQASIKEHYTQKSYIIPDYESVNVGLGTEAFDYLVSRGLTEPTLEANYIGENTYGQILFPYIKGDVVNIKARSLDKKFSLVKGAETCFYGIQNLFEDGRLATKKVFITEGEIDSLSLFECGFRHSLSVPNGAGVEEEGHPITTPKLEYLNDPDVVKIFEEVEEFILCTDADYKGQRLRDELAKRLGVERCFTVDYPVGCKDINDVLVQHGFEGVVECVSAARPLLPGLVTVDSLDNELLAYYDQGLEPGLTCGIDEFDNLYTLKDGLITLVTGIPEVKKSTLLDNILVGYAKKNDMHVAMFSPETKPVSFHVGRLASILTGKTMNRASKDRMDYVEFKAASEWVGKHFTFLQPPRATLPEIIQLAKLSILRYGTKIIVIDPYSRIRVETEREDKFIRDMLTDLSEFAVRYGVHIFIVAHPTKTETWGRSKSATEIKNYPIITPYQIKGAAEWFNSSDFILSLWKDLTIEDAPLKVFCLKSKYYHVAVSNQYCELDYDRRNWRLVSHARPLTNEASV
jgi:twinkle protein